MAELAHDPDNTPDATAQPLKRSLKNRVFTLPSYDRRVDGDLVEWGVCPARPAKAIHGNSLSFAFDLTLTETVALEVLSDRRVGALANIDFTGDGCMLYAGGEIRGVPYRRVIHAQVVANISDNDGASIQADAQLETNSL